jgi:RHS repeat-associated protein
VDKDGNLLDDGQRLDYYDALNRLVEVVRKSDGKEIAQYVYDADGRRVESVVMNNGLDGQAPNAVTTFNYAGADVIQQQDGGGTELQFVYGDAGLWTLDNRSNGVTAAQLNDGHTDVASADQRLYYLTDPEGSVYSLVNKANLLREAYQYDPYGRQMVYQAASPGMSINFGDAHTYTLVVDGFSQLGNPYLYAGYRLDRESNIYQVGARYYGAAQGRFVSQDPIGDAGGDGNWYRYVSNNPTSGTDPSGLEEKPTNPRMIDYSKLGYMRCAQCHGSANGEFRNLTGFANTRMEDVGALQRGMLALAAPSDAELASARAFWRRTGARGLSGLEAVGGAGAIFLGVTAAPLSLPAAAIFILHGADHLATGLVGVASGELQTSLTTRLFGPKVDQALGLAEMVYGPFIPLAGGAKAAPTAGSVAAEATDAEVVAAIRSIPTHYAQGTKILTPSPKLQRWVLDQLGYIDPATNEWVPITRGDAGTHIQAGHVYPSSLIRKLPGFEKLTPAQQDWLLNNPNNIIPLPGRQWNQSMGNRLADQWAKTPRGRLASKEFINDLRTGQQGFEGFAKEMIRFWLDE